MGYIDIYSLNKIFTPFSLARSISLNTFYTMTALYNSFVIAKNPSRQLSSGTSLKPGYQYVASVGATRLTFVSEGTRISSSQKRTDTHHSSSDGGRSGSTSLFIGGFVLGGLIVGTLGCVYAPQISEALTGADKKDLMKKLPKFIYNEEKALEAMASHAALASSRIPTSTRLPSKNSHFFPAQYFSKKLEVAEFSGLRSSGCLTFSKSNRDISFFDVVAAQLTPKTTGSTPLNGETVAKLKVAINGFGRIGRNFLRCWHGRKDSPLEVVVVNDSGGVKNASHLLKYDSMLGTFKADVKIVDKETISVDGKPIKVVSSRDPLQLPWAELEIDIVIEGTGVFVDGPGAGKHIQAGAKKVLITAPAKGADIPTYVVGVNEQDYSHEVADIISNASCTTNCLAPFVKIMDEEFGIVKGTMTTTHSYTGDQRLLDASHRDLRRARAAALNIVPTSTGAAKAVSLVLPQLKGKLNGIALRVPTPNVSVVDLVVNVEKKGLTAEDVNAAFRKAAEGPLAGVLDVCDIPLVSVDFRCSDVSSTIDSSLTMVMGDDMVKVVAWYDNEWGYSQRVVDLAHLVANKWPGASVQGNGDPLEDFCKTNPADEECKVYEA